MNKQEIGSITAKGGFSNELDICAKFNAYKTDAAAQKWLVLMGYVPEKISNCLAVRIPIRISLEKALGLGVSEEKYLETVKFKKADVQVRVEIVIEGILYIENISLKKANRSAGFNQVDKRPVLTYQAMWKFNDDMAKWLRFFTGDLLPESGLAIQDLAKIKDSRRLFLTEIPKDKLEEIILFFKTNKSLVIADILRGRGGLSAEWILVTCRNDDNSVDWVLKDINTVCNFYLQGEVKLSPRGSLKIGRVTMQRKGGTPDPSSLQFKINPLDLFQD